jgi:lipid-binding SYLF domain-containing protein
VAAGPVGRDASASTDIQMRAQILSYSRTRGLFAGVTLNGSTIRQDRDANDRFYGMGYRTGQIVFDGLGGGPTPVPDWKSVLERYGK